MAEADQGPLKAFYDICTLFSDYFALLFVMRALLGYEASVFFASKRANVCLFDCHLEYSSVRADKRKAVFPQCNWIQEMFSPFSSLFSSIIKIIIIAISAKLLFTSLVAMAEIFLIGWSGKAKLSGWYDEVDSPAKNDSTLWRSHWIKLDICFCLPMCWFRVDSKFLISVPFW